MEQLYSFLKKCSLLFVFGLIGYSSFGQSSTCGPIVQDFNNTGGSMAGFTSSTFLSSSSPGFVYGQTGQDGYLQRCGITSAGTVFTITSPTYQSTPLQTYVGYGFELSGQVAVSIVDIYVQFIDNNNDVTTVFDSQITPVYTGSGSNAVAAICDSFLLARATGFTAGESYRFVFQITSATSSNNNQCIVFDDFRTTGGAAAAPLPVSFIGFGTKKLDAGIQLIWNVAGERDVASYEVERSTNGRDFTKLGEVAANNSPAYSFIDRQPANGLVLYRIKETDVDGKFKYSTIVRLNLDISFGLRAYPSPARDLVTIEHAVTSKGKLSITAADGRIIRQIDIKPDLSQTVINISGLKAGLYIVRFANGNGQTETTKLIKE